MNHFRSLVCMAASMSLLLGCVGGRTHLSADSKPEARHALLAEATVNKHETQSKAGVRITPEEALLKGMRAIRNRADFYGTNWSIRFQPGARGGWFMKAVVPGDVGIRVLWVTIDYDGRTEVDNAF